MESKNKTSSIKFDITKCLITIENDELLDDVFRDFITLDYPRLHKMIKDGILPQRNVKTIKNLFKTVILKQKSFRDEYERFYNRDVPTHGEDIEEIIEEVVEVVEKPKVKKKKHRLNKKKLLEGTDGNLKTIHHAGLALLEYRNFYEKIERKIMDETIYDESFGDDKWKEFIGTVEIVKNKLNKLLKK